MIPRIAGDYYVKLNGWKFNVSSTIHSNARVDDVLEGLKILNEHTQNMFGILIEISFYKALNEFRKFQPSKSISRFYEIEPEMLDLLRLCYWYHKCLQIDPDSFFRFKSRELRKKLAEGLLSNVTSYGISVNDDFAGSNEQEFLIWIQEAVKKAAPPKLSDEKFPIYVEKLFEAIRSIISELMLAVLSNQDKSRTSFDSCPSPDHDYDFLINDIPVQVKAFNASENAAESKQKLEDLQNIRPINASKMEKEVGNFLKNPSRLETTEKAIDQGAHILFFNVSYICTGEIIRWYMYDNKLAVPLQEAVKYSINLLAKDDISYLPLIACVSNTCFNYQLDCLYFQIPVIKETGKKIKLDRGKMQGF
jgi:hypothetical protein